MGNVSNSIDCGMGLLSPRWWRGPLTLTTREMLSLPPATDTILFVHTLSSSMLVAPSPFAPVAAYLFRNGWCLVAGLGITVWSLFRPCPFDEYHSYLFSSFLLALVSSASCTLFLTLTCRCSLLWVGSRCHCLGTRDDHRLVEVGRRGVTKMGRVTAEGITGRRKTKGKEQGE